MSWSKPINITAQVKQPEWCFLLQGPGRGITLGDGTLLEGSRRREGTKYLEGKGEVTMSELVRNCLRMRPTRIIVGEIRGAEAVDMLQAISSGHEGCLAVLHASSPVDAV